METNIVLLDGKALSADTLDNEKKEIEIIEKKLGRKPYLVVITVGEDPASKVYVRNKEKACINCGITFFNKRFDENVSYDEISKYIKELNEDNNVDGILVQQPLPKEIRGVEQLVSDSKDVDGFTTYNLGNTLCNTEGDKSLYACTPYGITKFFDAYNIDITGKTVCIIGRSNIVGKPLIGLLLNKNATVISCNSYTENLKELTKNSDIIISAIGKAKYINSDFINDRTYAIIDVGMNRNEEGKLCGDVDFEDICSKWKDLNDNSTRYITPVPGGVGPMTVASLIHNIRISFSNKT